jgi:5-methylcytosine-specific restriction endonuclease McrA
MAVFCSCGLCRRCYERRRNSRRRFGGLREEILERDRHTCRVCGAGKSLHVHHRQPGINRPELLITLCASCHARLHRLAVLRFWIPEPLFPLWAEHHPGVPMQLQFPAEP